MLIKGLRNLYDREYAETKLGYQKQIDALNERLKTEENLTVKAAKALRQQIKLLNADMALELSRVTFDQQRDMDTKMKAAMKNMYEFQKQMLKDTEAGWDAALTLDLKINEIDSKLLKETLAQPVKEASRIVENTWVDFNQMTDEMIKEKYEDVFKYRNISVENGMKAALRELIAIYESDLQTAAVEYQNTVIAINETTKRTAQELENEHTKKVHDEGLKRIDLARKHAEILRQIEEGQSYDAYGRNEVEKTKILLEQSQERLRIAQEEAQRMKDERQQYTDEELTAMYGSVDEYNNLVEESNLKVVEAENNVKNAIKDVNDAIVAQKLRMIQDASAIMSAMNSIASAMQGVFETMAESDEKYSDYATAMAMMQILISTAISIANAIQGATAAGAATGPGAPIATPAFISEMIAIVAGAVASATTTLLKAKQQKPQAPKFAEGGQVRGKGTGTSDSIPSFLSNGEYVIKEKVVKEYGVDFFDRINFGNKLPFLDGIHFAQGGYVQSVLQTPNFTTETTFDYDLFKDMMSEAVSEVQPIVSVREINAVQKRVQVKETIARQ